MADSILETTKK